MCLFIANFNNFSNSLYKSSQTNIEFILPERAIAEMYTIILAKLEDDYRRL